VNSRSSLLLSSYPLLPQKLYYACVTKMLIEPKNVQRNHPKQNRIEKVTGPKVERVQNSNKQTTKPYKGQF